MQLGADGLSTEVVALSVDPEMGRLLMIARPGDDKIARRIHGHGRIDLRIECEAVDPKFPSLRGAGRVVALSEDPAEVSILHGAVPNDHEIAVGVHRNRGSGLR